MYGRVALVYYIATFVFLATTKYIYIYISTILHYIVHHICINYYSTTYDYAQKTKRFTRRGAQLINGLWDCWTALNTAPTMLDTTLHLRRLAGFLANLIHIMYALCTAFMGLPGERCVCAYTTKKSIKICDWACRIQVCKSCKPERSKKKIQKYHNLNAVSSCMYCSTAFTSLWVKAIRWIFLLV